MIRTTFFKKNHTKCLYHDPENLYHLCQCWPSFIFYESCDVCNGICKCEWINIPEIEFKQMSDEKHENIGVRVITKTVKEINTKAIQKIKTIINSTWVRGKYTKTLKTTNILSFNKQTKQTIERLFNEETTNFSLNKDGTPKTDNYSTQTIMESSGDGATQFNSRYATYTETFQKSDERKRWNVHNLHDMSFTELSERMKKELTDDTGVLPE